MKKVFCLFLSLTLLLFCLSSLAFAQERGKITLTGEKGTMARGDTFTAYLELNRNPGVVSLLTTLTYDPLVLEVFSVTDLGVLPGFVRSEETPGELILRWKAGENSEDLTSVGQLCQIVFRIKNDAPYGAVSVSPVISQRWYDAANQKGEAVPFDVQALEFELVCPHVNLETQVLTQPTFSQAGEGKRVCLDCGKEWAQQVLPSVTSSDGKTVGQVPPGQYAEEDEKGVRTDFLYGGEDSELARSLFGDTLLRTFHVTFTKNDGIFSPKGETRIRLTVDFDLPAEFALYRLNDGTAEKVDAQFSDGVLEFAYAQESFALVSRETALPPATTTAPPVSTAAPTTTLSPEELERRREIRYFALGFGALALCGTGAVILLRTKKRF